MRLVAVRFHESNNLEDVEESVVVCFECVRSFRTELGQPTQTKNCFVCHVLIRVHEVALDDVTVFGKFRFNYCLQCKTTF